MPYIGLLSYQKAFKLCNFRSGCLVMAGVCGCPPGWHVLLACGRCVHTVYSLVVYFIVHCFQCCCGINWPMLCLPSGSNVSQLVFVWLN